MLHKVGTAEGKSSLPKVFIYRYELAEIYGTDGYVDYIG